MKTLYLLNLLILGIGLSACQPKQHTAAEQQKFICRTLIDSFLKTQLMNDYRLDSMKPIRSDGLDNLLYTYTAQHRQQLNITPQQSKLRFNCQKLSARKFQIRLHQLEPSHLNSLVLLRIELPKQPIDNYIAYAAAAPKFSLLK